MQTTLLGFAIGLILALLAALVGPHFVNWNDQRARFEAEASRLVGVPVRVVGNIDAGILPFPQVTLEDIAIGPERQASRLRAQSLRIELGLGPLLRGEIRAVEMKVVGPQLSLGLDKDGRIDWTPLGLESETLSIDRLSIENGRATLTDAASQSQITIDQLRFSGEVRSLTGPLRGKGEFVVGGSRYGYDISAGRQTADGMRVKLALKTDERPMTIEAEGLFALERGTPGFDGVLTLARPAGAVLASGQTVAYEPWRLSSKIQAGTASAVMENVLFQYGPDERAAALTGSANFTFGARPQLQGRLSARQIDLDRLLATPLAPRRLPLAAVQAFGEMLGGTLRPSWPVKLSVSVDGLTMGGAMLQTVSSDLQSDGTDWSVDKLEFRAPGFTQVKVQGRLYPLGKGLGFSGGTSIDSSDPKNLAAWLTGRTTATTQIKPWRATGDVTLSADRIAVERLQTEFGRGAVEGSAAYTWSAENRPARLDAKLRAAEFDVDAAIGFSASAFSGLGLELPREVALAIEIDRALIAALEARKVTARLTLDGKGLAIERLSIADFGNATVEASGRIDTLDSPGGNVALDLNARDLDGFVALMEKNAPFLAEPLRRLAGQQKTAALRATMSLTNSGSDAAIGKLAVTGRIGAVRVNVAASAAGKRDAFTTARALADTDIKLDGQIEADDPAMLLALIGLDRIPAPERKSGRLSIKADGPPSRNFSFDAKLDAGPIDAGGKGVIRFPSDQPATLDLEQIAGTIAGEKVQGRLTLRFEDTLRADGAFEADTLDAPAVVAAAVGMRGGARAEWSVDPLAGSLPGVTGRIAFKAQRAVFAPTLVARQLSGVARLGDSELVLEEVAGEMGNGHFEGRLAFQRTDDGLSARLRATLNDAEAGLLFPRANGPAVSGKLSMQSEVEGAGRSAAALIGSLTGYGTITLEAGQVAGFNTGVFDAVGRALELGIPSEGDRIRQFALGVLDSVKVPVSRATASIRINAGLARFDEIAIPLAGADAKANGGINLSDGKIDALLTLTGQPTGSGKVRPSLLIALTGPVLTPSRTVDTSLLTSWLTLLNVERQSKQLDDMEKAARETPTPAPSNPAGRSRPAAPAEPITERALPAPDAGPAAVAPPVADPVPSAPASAPAQAPAAQAPALPPPVEVPGARPRTPARTESVAPRRPIGQPPGLVGSQY